MERDAPKTASTLTQRSRSISTTGLVASETVWRCECLEVMPWVAVRDRVLSGRLLRQLEEPQTGQRGEVLETGAPVVIENVTEVS